MYGMWTDDQIKAEIKKVQGMQYKASRRGQAGIVMKCEKMLDGLFREQDKRRNHPVVKKEEG